MKEKIVIVLEDLDDIKKTLEGLILLFRKIIEYYIKLENKKKLYSFAVYCSIYFGNLLEELGFSEGDLKDEPDNP